MILVSIEVRLFAGATMAIPIVHADAAVGAAEGLPVIGGRVRHRGQNFQGRCKFIRHGSHQLPNDAPASRDCRTQNACIISGSEQPEPFSLSPVSAGLVWPAEHHAMSSTRPAGSRECSAFLHGLPAS